MKRKVKRNQAEAKKVVDWFLKTVIGTRRGPAMKNTIKEVKRRLSAIGCECRLTEATYENIVAAGFNRSTLPQVFVLAQILVKIQPATCRSAFYRAVSAGVYPNTDGKHYRQTLGIILKLRRAGIVPYSWVTDGTRQSYKPSSWSGLEDYGEAVKQSYRRNFWGAQQHYVMVITEKDAMSGMLRPVADEYDIELNVIRGNCSESFVWAIAERLREIEKPIFIYYLGDHDPNGLDIERDIRQRLQGFMGRAVSWERLAITSDEFLSRADLTGFPVRQNGSVGWRTRCGSYIANYGDKCVEVDAISPTEIRQRLKDAIESHIDQVAWAQLRKTEALEKETIEATFGKWKGVA